MARKPRLYHDIDGVLFGEYTMFPGARPVYQLRPGTRDWFRWALKRFELVWLTTWRPDDLKGLLSTRTGLYLEHVWEQSRYLEFQTDLNLPVQTKVEARKRDVQNYDGLWLWIDDFPEGIPMEFPKTSLVAVQPFGAMALMELTTRLPARVKRLAEGRS